MKQQGSILLMALLTLSALIILCTKQWFSTSLLLDTVLAKEAQEKKVLVAAGTVGM